MPLTLEEAHELKQAILNGSLDDPLELLQLVDSYEKGNKFTQRDSHGFSGGGYTSYISYRTSYAPPINYIRDPFWDNEPEIDITRIQNSNIIEIQLRGTLRNMGMISTHSIIDLRTLVQLIPGSAVYNTYIANFARNLFDSFNSEIAKKLTDTRSQPLLISLIAQIQTIKLKP